MMCPDCHCPMKTIEGTEDGKWIDRYYMTQEVKLCSSCGLQIREYYEATKLTPLKEINI